MFLANDVVLKKGEGNKAKIKSGKLNYHAFGRSSRL